jgi:hypothetical protein
VFRRRRERADAQTPDASEQDAQTPETPEQDVQAPDASEADAQTPDAAEPEAAEPEAHDAQPAAPRTPNNGLDATSPPAGEPVTGSPGGPYDVTTAPEDGIVRLDLGVLRVPTPPGVEVGVQADQATMQALGVSFAVADSQLHIAAFAAPKSSGLWAEVRPEIAALLGAAGSVREVPGRFGMELHGTAVSDVPGRGRVSQPVRMFGVDGPRWFLRGSIYGRAVTDPIAARRCEELFASVVVCRGSDPKAPREPLSLVLSADLRQALGLELVTEARPVIDVYTRGPEITETR